MGDGQPSAQERRTPARRWLRRITHSGDSIARVVNFEMHLFKYSVNYQLINVWIADIC